MINLEQVKLLETKVAKAIDYIERLGKENADLHQKEADLQTKLDSYQKRIDELEDLVMRFKEDQGRIEDAILSALDRFNQFEEAIEKSLWNKGDHPAGTKGGKSKSHHAAAQHIQVEAPAPSDNDAESEDGDGKTCFEIPASETDDDIPDPLEPLDADDDSPEKNAELDIF
ncbi:MAG: hypothetical protein FWG46_05255 [Treponema sp.]|nr:hypothetical protein [Treponema sp.]